MYIALIFQTAKANEHLIQKWQVELDSADADTIIYSLQKFSATTISTNIRSFQYWRIRRIMGINSKLLRWGINVQYYLWLLLHRRGDIFTHVLYMWKGKSLLGWHKSMDKRTNRNPHTHQWCCTEEVLPIFDVFVTVSKIHIYICKCLGVYQIARFYNDNKVY